MRFAAAGVCIVVASLCVEAQTPPPRPGIGPAAPGPPGAPPTAQQPSGTARIRGRVVSATTGAPLRGAEVILSGDLLRQADTDDQGRFEFAALPAGRFTLNARKAGFSVSNTSRTSQDPGPSVTLADGQLVTREIALLMGGVIRGRVVDEFNEPVSGLEIRIERYQHGPAGRQLATASTGAIRGSRTNDLGEFRAFGLAPGDYVVSARSQQFGAPLMRGAAGAGDRAEGFLPTYYPGTIRMAEARSVRVRAGQESVANLGAVAGRMLRVSGTARRSNGTPASGLNVYLAVTTSNSSGQLDGGPVGADGSFTVANVPPGDYTLRVRQAGGGSPGNEVAWMPISLSTEDLTGLEIVTRPGTTVRGRVEWQGTAPRPVSPLRVTTRSAEPSNGLVGGESTTTYLDFQSGTVGEDDTFEIGGMVGAVLFGSSPALPWSLKAVSLDGKDITDLGVDAATLGGDARVVVTLTDQSTTVTGTARADGSKPIDDYVVVVLPERPVSGMGAMRYTRLLRSNDTGGFSVRGLPAGDYVAGALAALDAGEEWDPAIQKRVRSQGRPFTLSDGESVTLTLDVLR